MIVLLQGGCKHAIALLMWVHRRSEEPSCTEVQCYWQKSKLSRVGTTLKFISAKDLSKVDLINKIEAETRDQFKNNLWYELRYGRVTASKVYEVSRCQTDDGTLISIIMGVRYQTHQP
ncbi:hypothetical protein EVAR_89847_1 [Eumeta japonica]|uniref:Uncharacterized protein n=1 Tax=Eumeta variegata TaxID=151549 RepID=A0A4C1ZTS9_EUMVA|nr:hypothetical protein EVAR_89847_1 [Eumeta japonica]